MVVRPSRIVPGSRRTSGSSSTVASMYVRAGSTIVTPSRIQRRLMRLRSAASAFGELGAVVDHDRLAGILGRERDHLVAGGAQHARSRR